MLTSYFVSASTSEGQERPGRGSSTRRAATPPVTRGAALLSSFDLRWKQRRRPETDESKHDESEHRDGVRARAEGNG